MAGRNRIQELFHRTDIRGVTQFHMSLPPDVLHTETKGIVEYAVAWSLAIVNRISVWDCDHKWSTSMKLLDDRVRQFEWHQTLNIVRM